MIRYIKLLSSDEKCLGYLLYHHYHVTDVSLIDNCRSLIRTWDQNYAGGLVFLVCNLSSGKDNKSQIQYPCHKSIIDVDTTSWFSESMNLWWNISTCRWLLKTKESQIRYIKPVGILALINDSNQTTAL